MHLTASDSTVYAPWPRPSIRRVAERFAGDLTAA
jgi:hypothetical protein